MVFARFLIFFVVLFWVPISALADPYPAPSGWTVTTDGEVRIVRKASSQVRIGPWETLGGESIERWLERRVSSVSSGVKFLSSEDVKVEESIPGAYYVAQKTQIFGRSANSTLLACPGQVDTVRLMRLDVVGFNFGDMISGAKYLENVCLKEPKGMWGVTSNLNSASNETDSRPARTSQENNKERMKSSKLSPAPKLQGLQDVRGVLVYGMQAGGMFGLTEEYIALFEDGSFTSDVVSAFGQGKQSSQSANPEDWGRWRIRGGELELKENDEDSFDDTHGNWIAEAGSSNERLSGCYGNLTSSSGADYLNGTTVGLARSWCFYPNGRFTNQASMFGSSSDPSISMRGSNKSRGRYRINGYMARFLYDDGHEVVSVFSYVNDDRSHIMLNGKRFMGAKPD